VVNEKRIGELQEKKENLTKQITELKKQKKELKGKVDKSDQKVQIFSQIAKRTGEFKAKLSTEDLPIEEFIKIRDLYKSGTRIDSTKENGSLFLRQYCRFLQIEEPLIPLDV